MYIILLRFNYFVVKEKKYLIIWFLNKEKKIQLFGTGHGCVRMRLYVCKEPMNQFDLIENKIWYPN
jgi:hypothetical protein